MWVGAKYMVKRTIQQEEKPIAICDSAWKKGPFREISVIATVANCSVCATKICYNI